MLDSYTSSVTRTEALVLIHSFIHPSKLIFYSSHHVLAQSVKNLPAMQETWVRSLGWEDPLERERLPTPVFWPREFHGLSMGSQRVGHN